MNVLLIGSSGFIGSHLVPKLVDSGHTVVGFDLVVPESSRGLSNFIQGDVRIANDFQKSFEEIDCVINLAAVHRDSGHTIDEYWDTNDRGMQQLLAAMESYQVKRLVFTSSVAVYGEHDFEVCEETEPVPTSPYGASKLSAEKRVLDWVARDEARAATILRPCVVFGERNVANMYNLIRQIQSGWFFIAGAGENVKSLAYVGNLVAAIAFCLERSAHGVQTYNYVDKPDLTVKETVSNVSRTLGKPRQPRHLPLSILALVARPFEMMSRLRGQVPTISSARVRKLAARTQFAATKIREAGFVPTVSLLEGIERMVHDMYPDLKETPTQLG